MPVPATFKANVVPSKGAQTVIADRSLPPLAAGEVAIRITATAVNPVDWKMRDLGYFLETYPAVLGSDAAGEVAAVGPGEVAGRFTEGDRVFFQGVLGDYDACTFQQYCRMPAALLARTPSRTTDEQAAGVSIATMAPVVAFYDAKTGRGLNPPPWDEANGGSKVGRNKSIVVLGGSSSVGQYAIQLARLSGFARIVTAAGAKHREHLERLGAHVVLDRAAAGVEDFVSALGERYPLEMVFDAISLEETFTLGVKIIQATGKSAAGASVIGVLPPPDGDEFAELCRGGSGPGVETVSVTSVFGIGSSPELRHLSEPLFAHLGGEEGWIARGLFEPNRPVVVPGGLAAVEEALEKNKRGVSGVKVVFQPNA
ncbi:GroES-like protein [Xylariaceae sp. FL0804]|nr:GroES-like protein [Xylariaceae sp. FL0804]